LLFSEVFFVMATRRASVNEHTPLILPPEDSFSPQDFTDTYSDDESTPVNGSDHGEDGTPAVSSTLIVFVLTFGACIIPVQWEPIPNKCDQVFLSPR
jgi:hypothetical protein